MKEVDEKRNQRNGKALEAYTVLAKPSPRRAAPQPAPFNLLDIALFRRLIQSRLYPGALQWATVLVFAVVIYQLVAGPSAAHDNFGTAMTWVLWWPLIPLFFLVLGRFWCAICPFATVSDLVQRVVGHNRAVPAFLKKYGIWIIDALFIGITWSDSRAGAMELRATPSKCAKCSVQACYRGGEKAPGCPMFEFPRAMDTNARCNLCGYCVKNCPNDSIRISARIPSSELWGIRRPKFEESFLACVIMGVVFVQNITMLGVWKGILSWLEGVTGTDSYFVTFTIAFAVAMALPILALFGASYFANLTGKRGVLATFTIFGYALIPLDLAGHLAHNLFHLLAEGKNILYTALSMFGVQSQGSAALLDSATIQVLQYLLVVAGVAGSAYTAYRISSGKSTGARGTATWLPIATLAVVLGIANLVLFYLPMVMRM
jgi:ferredoxin